MRIEVRVWGRGDRGEGVGERIEVWGWLMEGRCLTWREGGVGGGEGGERS